MSIKTIFSEVEVELLKEMWKNTDSSKLVDNTIKVLYSNVIFLFALNFCSFMQVIIDKNHHLSKNLPFNETSTQAAEKIKPSVASVLGEVNFCRKLF